MNVKTRLDTRFCLFEYCLDYSEYEWLSAIEALHNRWKISIHGLKIAFDFQERASAADGRCLVMSVTRVKAGRLEIVEDM